MMDLFNFAPPKRRKGSDTAAFIFDWDVEEGDGTIIGIIKDVRLRDSKGRDIRHSSLVMEDMGSAGWEAFLDANDMVVSGRYRWEGRYFASQDYEGEWDCGWDLISLEPADRRTRRAVAAYGKGWNELNATS